MFVEKPFTSSSAQAEELIELAERKNLTIMVDHTFLFTGAVRKIRELIESGALGDLYYYDSLRVNLGLFQHDVNVIWDLAPHDLSIMDHLIKSEPEAVVATGERHLNGVEDVAFMTIYFPNNVIAHINVNWLSPVKVRTTLIGGQKKMLVWNDLEADEKIKVYDKGVQINIRRRHPRLAGQLPLRRHVGAADRTGRSAARGAGLFRRLHHERQDAVQRRPRRLARRANAGSRRALHPEERRVDRTVNEFCVIAPDVKLGKDVKLSKFINLYGCEIGDETKIGAFVEIQKNASVGRRCKISSHTFVCEGVTIEDNVFIGHGVTFINDIVSARNHRRRRTADREGLESGEDAGEARRFDRLRRDDSVQRDHRRKRHRRRGQRGDPRRARQRDCCRKSGKSFAFNLQCANEG